LPASMVGNEASAFSSSAADTILDAAKTYGGFEIFILKCPATVFERGSKKLNVVARDHVGIAGLSNSTSRQSPSPSPACDPLFLAVALVIRGGSWPPKEPVVKKADAREASEDKSPRCQPIAAHFYEQRAHLQVVLNAGT
jgi:hypothetical protein